MGTGAILSGRYRLDRVLGEGGMGVVWEATDIASGKRVAIKCVKPASRLPASEQRRRLEREARAIRAIDHPNLVRVQEVITGEDGAPAIVMELLPGESLRTKLDRETKLSLGDTARIVLPILSAVGSAHALGIVHRDLKPDNIFLTSPTDLEPSGVRVLDFGIAKLTAQEGEAAGTGVLTVSGALMGTPYYMSPEQVFGEKDIDSRADVWALGVVLFECLAGRRPVEGQNAGQVLRVIATGKITALAEVSPELPLDVTALVDRMLAVDRASRPADLREAYEVLRRFTNIEAKSFAPATLPGDSSSKIATNGARGTRYARLAMGAAAILIVGGATWATATRLRASEASGSPPVTPAVTTSTPAPTNVAALILPDPSSAASAIVVAPPPPAHKVVRDAAPARSGDRFANDFDHQ